QAEDGIRDFHVTGVQTCALPICFGHAAPLRRPATAGPWGGADHKRNAMSAENPRQIFTPRRGLFYMKLHLSFLLPLLQIMHFTESEERRVGHVVNSFDWRGSQSK